MSRTINRARSRWLSSAQVLYWMVVVKTFRIFHMFQGQQKCTRHSAGTHNNSTRNCSLHSEGSPPRQRRRPQQQYSHNNSQSPRRMLLVLFLLLLLVPRYVVPSGCVLQEDMKHVYCPSAGFLLIEAAYRILLETTGSTKQYPVLNNSGINISGIRIMTF